MVHRSKNSHQQMVDRHPFIARLWREPPFWAADERALEEAANRIAGPTGWHAEAGWRKDAGCRRYRFATADEAATMQEWIDASGIENREPPPAWDGPQLGVR